MNTDQYFVSIISLEERSKMKEENYGLMQI